ncbi:hypothetical protein [Verrucomicrobium spinosum]|uniref:hypothetical protein n=1 Tax=Verrucomicrobium spinosum TaxID=2736 RepID=UPI0012E1DD68|nr:hypothetical protein [Verrucomicrobium spinosum]
MFSSARRYLHKALLLVPLAGTHLHALPPDPVLVKSVGTTDAQRNSIGFYYMESLSSLRKVGPWSIKSRALPPPEPDDVVVTMDGQVAERIIPEPGGAPCIDATMEGEFSEPYPWYHTVVNLPRSGGPSQLRPASLSPHQLPPTALRTRSTSSLSRSPDPRK